MIPRANAWAKKSPGESWKVEHGTKCRRSSIQTNTEPLAKVPSSPTFDRSRSAKPTFDDIDRVLAPHDGFTEEELDFIPLTQLRADIHSTKFRAGNYDIKYRMRRDAENEEE